MRPNPATIVDRLRGIYRLPINDGVGPINGSDEFIRKFDGLPPINEEAAAEILRLRTALATAEAEARRYAGFYPQNSDCRNTLVILADRIASLGEIS